MEQILTDNKLSEVRKQLMACGHYPGGFCNACAEKAVMVMESHAALLRKAREYEEALADIAARGGNNLTSRGMAETARRVFRGE